MQLLRQDKLVLLLEKCHREDMGWIYGPGEITEQIRQELEPIGSIDKHYVVGVVPNIVEAFAGPTKIIETTLTLLDTPLPDSAFKTADLPKDPFAKEGSITKSDMRHEDWEEG